LVGSRWNNPNSPGAGHPEKSADARIVEFTQIPPHAERNPQSHPPACVPPTDYSSLEHFYKRCSCISQKLVRFPTFSRTQNAT
jgi:hypothetical protein